MGTVFFVGREIQPVFTDGMPQYEDGVTQSFNTKNEATDYARFSIGRQHRHRYISIGNSVYICSFQTSKCPSRRKLSKNGLIFDVKGSGHHNHTDIAKGKRVFLSDAENAAFRKAPRLFSPTVKQAFKPELGLSQRQFANKTQYEATKVAHSSITQWISKRTDIDGGPSIAGYRVSNQSWVVVLSSDVWIQNALAEDAPVCAKGFVCVDGHFKKSMPFTIFRIGVVDIGHHYYDLAIGLLSGREGSKEILDFLRILDTFVRRKSNGTKSLLILKVMCDGSMSIRNAFKEYQSQPKI